MARPELIVVGLSHKTAALDVREKLAFADAEIDATLREIRELPAVNEVALVSTCNRVEVYAATENGQAHAAVAEIRRFLSSSRAIDDEMLAGCLYEQTGSAAVTHIFRVAAALDSLVVGEPQILGQLKSAYGAALRTGSVGPLLGRCLENAFATAKRVRTETGISRGGANVSSVAVELAKRIFDDLTGKQVLLVGAGKMSRLAARHLRADGALDVLVTNRSPEKAEEIARAVDGKARRFEELEALLATADVVLTSTGSSQPIISRELMKRVMRERRQAPIFLIDIAVPRNVEPQAGKLGGVYLFDIDDLEKVVADNLRARQREAERAEKIVAGEVETFGKWMRTHEAVPTIKELRERFLAIARAEAERTVRRLSHLGERDHQAVRALADAIANKLLHAPLMRLKHDDEAIEKLVVATRRLFELSGGEADEPVPVGGHGASAPARDPVPDGDEHAQPLAPQRSVKP